MFSQASLWSCCNHRGVLMLQRRLCVSSVVKPAAIAEPGATQGPALEFIFKQAVSPPHHFQNEGRIKAVCNSQEETRGNWRAEAKHFSNTALETVGWKNHVPLFKVFVYKYKVYCRFYDNYLTLFVLLQNLWTIKASLNLVEVPVLPVPVSLQYNCIEQEKWTCTAGFLTLAKKLQAFMNKNDFVCFVSKSNKLYCPKGKFLLGKVLSRCRRNIHIYLLIYVQHTFIQ